MKKALITGITGQDGSYLAELLLEKGYEVHGIMRRSSSFNTSKIDHLYTDPHIFGTKLFLHFGDISDSQVVRKLLTNTQPDEVYNLAAQSHVRVSFDIPEYTADVTGLGVIRILEAIKDYQQEVGKQAKFYQASSSEMFGSTPPPQNEATPFHPRSPYACAKVFGYHTTVNYREAYDLYAVNGILFNHESPRRGETFVTRKITRGIARILAGLDEKLYLGNLEAQRDWGYAKEYMDAAWRMLQQPTPEDFVIGTGEMHTVREFLDLAFEAAGVSDWSKLVEIDKRYFRPTEVDALCADASKAKQFLNWTPTTSFKDLVTLMMEAELKTYGVTR
jgi:GDPmannose 4,6-dehydratase